MHTFTHKGQLSGDARAGDKRPWVALRSTILHWVDTTGGKYRKTSGRGMGDWPMWSLELDTVQELKKPVRI